MSKLQAGDLSEAAKRAIHRQAPDGVRRAARAAACRRCGASVMRGLDDEACARAVAVDPAPLSQAGELAALLSGRSTYALTWVAGRGRYEIDFREPVTIERKPPGSQVNVDVVAIHECNAPFLDTMKTSVIRKSVEPLPRRAPF